MLPDFWTAIEKGLQHYTRNVSQNNNGAAAPFPVTFNNPRNLLRQAFREYDEIGWSGMFKGRIATYSTTSECKRDQIENARMGTKTYQRNVRPYNSSLALS
jgi:hypothetical protein